jgi:glucose/arabinose dehydrogenase
MALICQAQYIVAPAYPNLSSFSFPVEIVNAGDGSNRLFVVQITGRIMVFNNETGVSTKKTFIDLSGKISFGGASGLLGLAFHPDYNSNRHFYVNHTFDSAGVRWFRVARYTASSENPDTALINSESILLTTQLVGGSLHTGGKIAFGPDGYLYSSIGEGNPHSNPSPAQNRTNLLGKVLRINVDSPSGDKSYSIPESNPYYQNTDGYREEIYAYGLRNPWKFSFDFETNRLWLADVGEYLFEEINLIENGKNYGWDKMEGFGCRGACDTTGKGFSRPVFAYPNTAGAAVMGGYVYRGALHPDLYGKYIYCDQVQGNIWSLEYDGVNPPVNTQLLDTSGGLVTFGEDENKELYISTYSTGRIFKLVNLGKITLNLKAAIEGFYNVDNNKLNIRDTISVYLRSSEAPYSIVDSSRTVIDSTAFSGLCFFNNAPTGKYYLALKHRNALETWSIADSIKRGELQNYDFTNDISKAYGNNLLLKGSRYCIYSGDVNHDGVIDQDDILEISNNGTNFVTGYVNTDLDGDGSTELTDLLIAYDNSTNFVQSVIP